MEFKEQPKYEHILLAIDDQIALIHKTNEAISRNQGDSLQVEQLLDLKNQHTATLQELLSHIFSTYQIELKISA
ncbi:MAG: type I secretion C-terminal target domain-containing protein [Thermonemataceae bacterium]